MANYQGFALAELMDIYTVFVNHGRQDTVAIREYRERYPNRICPGELSSEICTSVINSKETLSQDRKMDARYVFFLMLTVKADTDF